MKHFVAVLVLLLASVAVAQDADTLIKVQKARQEVPGCVKLVKSSQALGSVQLHFMTYTELDRSASALSHCAFVFLTVGDEKHAEDAGNEGDRYDATTSTHMEKYLKARGMWTDFTKQDCRVTSETCGK